MASKNRKRLRSAKRVAAMSVATATVTALVVGAAPPPLANGAAPPIGGVSSACASETIAVHLLVNALALALSSNQIQSGQPLAATPE